MIDYFALALMHGLLLVALLRLVRRTDVDADLASDPANDGDNGSGSRPTATRPATRKARRRMRAMRDDRGA